MMRPRIWPVVPVSTGVLTHSLLLGVTDVADDAFAGTAVATALSPCQPLLRPMSPCMRRSLEMVIRPPRLGTSCHINLLELPTLMGLTMKKLATYSTLPFVRSARERSVISPLCGSPGSSSPKARPVIVSYWPTAPCVGQSGGVPGGLPAGGGKHKGEVLLSTIIFVTRASVGGAQASDTAAAMPNKADLLKSSFMSFSLVRCFLDLFSPSYCFLLNPGRNGRHRHGPRDARRDDHHRACSRPRPRAAGPSR